MGGLLHPVYFCLTPELKIIPPSVFKNLAKAFNLIADLERSKVCKHQCNKKPASTVLSNTITFIFRRSQKVQQSWSK